MCRYSKSFRLSTITSSQRTRPFKSFAAFLSCVFLTGCPEPVNPNPEPEVKEIKLMLVDESGQEIYLYAYVEGPAIKLNIPVPESVVLDDSASIKPSSLNNSLYFWDIKLYADGNNIDYISLKSNGKMSSYVIKKDNYFVLNKTCAKDSDLAGFFSSGSHTYEVSATLKAGSSDSIVYKQTKTVTVNSGEDISLDFNALQPYTNAGTANLYGYLFLNFITGDSITVPGIKFADETNATRVTNNEWSKRTYGDDIGTKTILVYVTKDGQTYSAPINSITTNLRSITTTSLLIIEWLESSSGGFDWAQPPQIFGQPPQIFAQPPQFFLFLVILRIPPGKLRGRIYSFLEGRTAVLLFLCRRIFASRG